MDRPSMGEKTAQASNVVQNALNPKPNSMEQIAIARAEAAKAAAERAFAAHVNALTARVEALEVALRRLQTCTVQQFADGRLYLPAGNKLRFEVPGPYGPWYQTVDLTKCDVEAPRPLTAGPPSPAGYVVVSTHAPAPSLPSGPAVPPAPSGPAGQSLQSIAGGRGNWQSIAGSNTMNDPRKP